MRLVRYVADAHEQSGARREIVRLQRALASASEHRPAQQQAAADRQLSEFQAGQFRMARKHVTHRRVQPPVTTYFPLPGQLELWLGSASDPVLADLAGRSTKATVSAWRWPQAASSANSSQNVTGSVSRRSQIRSDRRLWMSTSLMDILLGRRAEHPSRLRWCPVKDSAGGIGILAVPPIGHGPGLAGDFSRGLKSRASAAVGASCHAASSASVPLILGETRDAAPDRFRSGGQAGALG